jgi:hypothetical protein
MQIFGHYLAPLLQKVCADEAVDKPAESALAEPGSNDENGEEPQTTIGNKGCNLESKTAGNASY